MEEVYGYINKAFEDLQFIKIKVIRAPLYSVIKVEDDNVTLKSLGNLLYISDLERLWIVINGAFNVIMSEVEENIVE